MSEYNYCHFRPMEYRTGDSDDVGNFEEWLECEICGHTKPLPQPPGEGEG